MVYPEPANLGSCDGCSRPIRSHDDSVLFQGYGCHLKPLLLAGADGVYSGIPACEGASVEAAVGRTCVGSYTR